MDYLLDGIYYYINIYVDYICCNKSKIVFTMSPDHETQQNKTDHEFINTGIMGMT